MSGTADFLGWQNSKVRKQRIKKLTEFICQTKDFNNFALTKHSDTRFVNVMI